MYVAHMKMFLVNVSDTCQSHIILLRKGVHTYMAVKFVPSVPPLDAMWLTQDNKTLYCLQKIGEKFESYNLLVTEFNEIIPFKRVF